MNAYMRLLGTRIFVVASIIIALFLAPIGAADAATKVWSLISPLDSYNRPDINPYYDLDYLSAGEFDDDIASKNNMIYFWLHFKTPVTQNMFNDNQGSWAGLLFDYDGDGTDDLKIEIDRISFKANLYSTPVWLNSPLSGGGIGRCGAVAYTNLDISAKWVGIKFDKSCVGLPNSFYVDGFVDYIPADNAAYDYVGEWYLALPNTAPTTTTTTVAPTTTTTTTVAPTTTTTTTLPKVQIPNAPSSVSISKLSETAIRLTWLDNSTNEDGFLIQRNDLPVPAGTSVAAWPYKTGGNVPTIDFGGLASNGSYCFAISAFNTAGSSPFTDTACFNLTSAATSSVSSISSTSLTCDATRVSANKIAVEIVVDAGASNAGKKLIFEAFRNGKWSKIGSGRVTAAGVTALTVKTSLIGQKETSPIRATQGSRFICEGSLK